MYGDTIIVQSSSSGKFRLFTIAPYEAETSVDSVKFVVETSHYSKTIISSSAYSEISFYGESVTPAKFGYLPIDLFVLCQDSSFLLTDGDCNCTVYFKYEGITEEDERGSFKFSFDDLISEETLIVNSSTGPSAPTGFFGTLLTGIKDYVDDNQQGVFLRGVSGTDSAMQNTGDGITSTGNRALAVNRKTVATGPNSLAANYMSEASGDGASAFNSKTVASGSHSFAIGENTEANGIASFAGGVASKAYGDFDFVSGNGNEVNKTSLEFVPDIEGGSSDDGSEGEAVTHTLGNLGGFAAMSSGVTNHVAGNGAVAFNQNNIVVGDSNAAFGYMNVSGIEKFKTEGSTSYSDVIPGEAISVQEADEIVYKTSNLATGYQTKASGGAASSFGSNTKATHDSSLVSGNGTKSSRASSLVCGNFNDPIRGDLFEVGNGTSDSLRKTAFAVTDNTQTPTIRLGATTLSEQELIGIKAGGDGGGKKWLADGQWSRILTYTVDEEIKRIIIDKITIDGQEVNILTLGYTECFIKSECKAPISATSGNKDGSFWLNGAGGGTNLYVTSMTGGSPGTLRISYIYGCVSSETFTTGKYGLYYEQFQPNTSADWSSTANRAMFRDGASIRDVITMLVFDSGDASAFGVGSKLTILLR